MKFALQLRKPNRKKMTIPSRTLDLEGIRFFIEKINNLHYTVSYP